MILMYCHADAADISHDHTQSRASGTEEASKDFIFKYYHDRFHLSEKTEDCYYGYDKFSMHLFCRKTKYHRKGWNPPVVGIQMLISIRFSAQRKALQSLADLYEGTNFLRRSLQAIRLRHTRTNYCPST